MVLQGLISALIGAIAWSGSMWTIPLSLTMPALIFAQPTRISAATVAAAYYAAASWPLMASARAFWSLAVTSPWPPLAWAAASAMLALPWVALWSAERKQALWRCPLVLVIGALPPLGIIGWASPLVSAGVLFPGTAWLGLAATVATAQPRFVPIAAAASLVANIVASAPEQPRGWAALNTSVVTPKRSDPMVDLDAVEELQSRARATTAQFILAPESAAQRWNEATAEFWQPTADALKSRQATLLLGTTIGNPGTTEYRNVLLGIGANPVLFVQRNPVPFAMWKPFGPRGGTHLRLSGRSTIGIGNHRAAILICYEQLLVWPILQSALERPMIILGIANDYWCRGTRVPANQQACLRAWARLFGLPWLGAVNS